MTVTLGARNDHHAERDDYSADSEHHAERDDYCDGQVSGLPP